MATAPKQPARKRSPRRKLEATTPEAPAFDTRRGEVNIWPILAAEPEQLAAEIVAGDHDAYLHDLEWQDKAQHDGRPVVQDAIRKRRGL